MVLVAGIRQGDAVENKGQAWPQHCIPARCWELPAPGDTARHFHSKGLCCCRLATFSGLRHFSLFPEKCKAAGVISCPWESWWGTPPWLRRHWERGQICPRCWVGVWGDSARQESATGRWLQAASPHWPRLHACHYSGAPPGWCVLLVHMPSPQPSGGSAPSFGATTCKMRVIATRGAGGTPATPLPIALL